MFLGGIPKNGINFMAPAGLHRARWMAKGIYAIKVYMFRGEFKMTKKEEVAITELCMFVVSIYVYHWFQAPSCRFAPRNDLKLLKDLKAYNKVNEAIAEVALKKFSGHLWYLSEVLVAFAFFDENVPLETKTKMVQALENEGQEDTLRRITIDSRTMVKYFFDLHENILVPTQEEVTQIDLSLPQEWTQGYSYLARVCFERVWSLEQSLSPNIVPKKDGRLGHHKEWI
ncbi:unnamed protein product [Nesidiocoris tenuis]|uniref:Uncharacterized protein n=1 Tax=Nesidiocoris tenuis TaxID=355587 RepID=A0A6H5FZT2_9HEMI|nr:unnamed protein product [Nesidiocoris tenuis]